MRQNFIQWPHPLKTWVELAVVETVGGDRAIAADNIRYALAFHRAVSQKADAHMDLILENTFWTPWSAAKLIGNDSAAAQIATQLLATHLVTVIPTNRTPFEKHLFQASVLWEELAAFSDADPPVLLWHGNGRHERRVKFLA